MASEAWSRLPVGFSEKYTVEGIEYTVAAHSVTTGGYHWRLLYREVTEMTAALSHITHEPPEEETP